RYSAIFPGLDASSFLYDGNGRPQLTEFFDDAVITPLDVIHPGDFRPALGEHGRDQVGETGAQVRDFYGSPFEGRRALDDRGMFVPGIPEPAIAPPQAFAVELDAGAHAVQGFRVSEAVFVNGFMNDRHALGLSEQYDHGLLPVGHQSGMHAGFDGYGLETGVHSLEADPVFQDFVFSARLAQPIQEGEHVQLVGAAYEYVAAGGDGRGGEGSGLDAIVDDPVLGRMQRVHALDNPGAVRFLGDDGSHGLQEKRQVHYFGFDGGVADLGGSPGGGRGHHQVFGGAHAGKRQGYPGAFEAPGREAVHA